MQLKLRKVEKKKIEEKKAVCKITKKSKELISLNLKKI